MKKGRLIVIDGADGCGKQTQTTLLREGLVQKGMQAEQIDFPRYNDNFFGGLLGQFQTNKEMEFSKIHPILASIVYAADRFESKSQIEGWLNAGVHVISDRYVSANQLHQAGKIINEEERRIFMQQLDRMEHEVFSIPRPDLVILLDIPYHISLKLMQEKSSVSKKEYSSKKTDWVEQDEEYQLNARESGIKMLSNESWFSINCSEDGETLLPIEVIHQKILERSLQIL